MVSMYASPGTSGGANSNTAPQGLPAVDAPYTFPCCPDITLTNPAFRLVPADRKSTDSLHVPPAVVGGVTLYTAPSVGNKYGVVPYKAPFPPRAGLATGETPSPFCGAK